MCGLKALRSHDSAGYRSGDCVLRLAIIARVPARLDRAIRAVGERARSRWPMSNMLGFSLAIAAEPDTEEDL